MKTATGVACPEARSKACNLGLSTSALGRSPTKSPPFGSAWVASGFAGKMEDAEICPEQVPTSLRLDHKCCLLPAACCSFGRGPGGLGHDGGMHPWGFTWVLLVVAFKIFVVFYFKILDYEILSCL